MFILPENNKLRGYENYAAWKILMGINGRPKELHKYWENKVVVPAGLDDNDPISTETPTGKTTPVSPAATTTTQTPVPTPLLSTTPTLLEYELHENVALSSVLINIADLSGSGIDASGTTKAHVAWKFLEDQYGRTSDRARNMREEKLSRFKMAEGAIIVGAGGHIEKMHTLWKLANDTGANIDNQRFITKLLDSFPESWDPVINNMYNEKDLNTVIMNLTTHAERLTIREGKTKDENSPPVTVDIVKALEATILALQAEMRSFKPYNQRERGTTNPNKAHLICSNSLCRKIGHLIEDCFGQGGGKAGQYPPWYKGKRITRSANMATSSTSSGSTLTGTHWALSATFNLKEIEMILQENSVIDTRTPSLSAGNRFVLPGAINPDDIKRLIEEVIPIECKVALAAAANPETIGIGSACVADSGCTTYFFKSRDVFSIYKPLDKAIGQSSMVGANFRVLGMGTVEIKVVHENTEHTLEFTNALHAPDVTANLISIGRMDLAGWEVIFGKQKARFFMEKQEVFGGVLKDGLYLVGGSIVSNIPTILTARSLKSPADLALWHRRFAHFGTTRISEASRLVDGLVITNKETLGKCEDCIIGNQKRRAYDEKVEAETEVLRLTNIDLWRPARVPSAGGALYGMKFHDNGSSRKRTFFIPNRTAAAIAVTFIHEYLGIPQVTS